MADVDVFALPSDWQLYQAELGFGGDDLDLVTIAAEPHMSVAVPTITLDIAKADGKSTTVFLSAVEAEEIWTSLGFAIRNATGRDPIKCPHQVKSMQSKT